MNTPQTLNHFSPIVQRVFRFRERFALYETATEKVPTFPEKRPASTNSAENRTRYQWQMWQKSDFSAYAANGSEHRCKGVNLPLSPGREEDGIEGQGAPVLSQGISS